MQISWYGRRYVLQPERRTVAWPHAFLDWNDAETDDDKGKVALFSCDLYKPGKGRESGLSRSNVEAVSGLILDYDDDHGVTIEQAEACWSEYDYTIYTTYSHQKPPMLKDAFRVVLPFPAPITVAEYEHFVKVWAVPFSAARDAKFKPLPVGHAGFYLPTRRVGASHYSRHNAGHILDPSSLAPLPAAPPVPEASHTRSADGRLIHLLRATQAATQPSAGGPAPEDVFRGIDTAHEVADLATLEAHCSFLRHGRTNATTLSEPEWRSWLSLVARTRNGTATAHEISSAYPKYSREETEDKIQRLLTEAGPHSCEHIASVSERGGCAECPLRGRIRSPMFIQSVVERTGATSTEEVVTGAEQHQRRLELDAEVREALDAVDTARRRLAELKLAESARKRRARSSPSLNNLVGEDPEASAAAVEIEQAKREVNAAERNLRLVQNRARTRANLDGPDPDVLDSLATDGMGVPHSSRLNVERILLNDPAYRDSFKFDTFAQKILYDGEPAEDHRDVRLTVDMERRYGLRVEPRAVRDVAAMIAYQNQFHPVKDALRGLTWDGVERLDLLMARGFGAPITMLQTADYLADVGRKLCISAVARVFEPESKNEMIVVATGDQGAFKSTAFSVLAWRPEWFGDSHLPLGNKDAYMAIQGKWFYEIAEMDSFKKAESTAIKSFLSSRSDTYRPPFGAHTITRNRNTVFVGTTNEDHFLDDPTGSRRYAPVRTGRCDIDWLKTNVAQLWAEAVVRFDRKERWWYSGEESDRLKRASSEFQVTDAWAVIVLDAIFNPANPPDGFYTNERILIDWINVPKDRISKREKNRIASVMKQLGFKPVRLQQMREAIRIGYTHAPLGYWINDEARAALREEDDNENVIPFYAPDEVF